MTDDAPPAAGPCIILNEPQLAENIGAAARVMANFGLEDLRLVRPRDGWPQGRAWASASGAEWPLDNAKVHQRLEAATADLHRVYATTARPREVKLPIMTPREAAADALRHVQAGRRVGYLFGGERAGLETQDFGLCHVIVTVPVSPRFKSLNLAQAVSLNAYEWGMLVNDAPAAAFTANQGQIADGAALDGLFNHLERELDEAGFFHPADKRPSMVRNLRAIFARASLDEQEVRTLRGVITALSRGRGRVLAKLAEQKAREGK